MKNNIFSFLSTALVACNGLGTKHVYDSSPAELMQEVPAVATCNLQLVKMRVSLTTRWLGSLRYRVWV